MAVYQFYAIIQKDEEDDGYIVTFPDLDNCFTFGETLVEAVEMAEDVLLTVLDYMEEIGEDIPIASSVEKLKELLPSGASLVNIEIDTDTLTNVS
ncbi:HicB family protein [Anoxybacillus flavithermus]|uniref:HicB family protein n=1 Tax=Anoxybacillus flavithermus TaxID=33934 RepID=A0A2G5RME4_9BACL|nr:MULTISPECIES: type II toxin-antitoxin system HicB family antitoxin [Anoxybacillus]KFZ42272.1 antitoxin HicB [Anoxybacillus sp. KU2-6(11)]MCL6615845.1 type II toxin-antitoxin system HicB family antitoxin [Anoxybacillus ayderensis]PIC03984.1 HicB family protein [Anoxybacillus flavithermus]